MNFSQLRYILSVDRHRSFSRAAEECGVAQSTLSKEIQRLEKEFDIIIFDRSRFPIVPTLKGMDLIFQANRILEEKRKFIQVAEEKNNEPNGVFTLGILPTLAPYLLPLFIHSLSKKYSGLTVKVLEFTTQQMLSQFENGDLDGAIGISPFIKEGFYEENLFRENFVLYVGSEHPLFKKKEIQWSEIPLGELLLHEAFKSYLLSSEELKRRNALDLQNLANIDYQNGSLETIRKIIDRNGGLTILPHLSTLYMGERRLKMVRPIVNPILSRMITFITPRGFEKKRISKVIKEELIKSLPKV